MKWVLTLGEKGRRESERRGVWRERGAPLSRERERERDGEDRVKCLFSVREK